MPEFQRYEYFAEGKNVTVTVKGGKVTGIGVLEFTSK
jgi:YD repeat-containing protein